ncbi:hypothetical protein C8R44DRAFT_747194 [Mycena epipterygia]|nr:hypothetical protein C8R44DRAFT_747194 [Mycena epipterygia]
MACQGIEITPGTSDALRACIEYGDLKRGVALVEQGLATSLRQRLQLKTRPHESLLSEEDRTKLEGLSFVLCNRDASVEERQQAAAERHILLADIRKKYGLASFLRRREYDELRHASKRGPIVILNSPEKLGEQKGKLDQLLRSTSRRSPSTTESWAYSQLWGTQAQYRNFVRKMPNVKEKFEEVLEWLWGNIVAPLYEELNANEIMDGRLWCPTGSFIGLPLHAAVY